MTLQDFIDKWLGQTKGYPTDDQYKGECLSKEVIWLIYLKTRS